MALFNRFPFSNAHELNLDWILKKTRENTDAAAAAQEQADAALALAQDAMTSGPVLSVASKTGAVTLDAGDVTYDEKTYPAGTVGDAIRNTNSEIDFVTDDIVSANQFDGVSESGFLGTNGNVNTSTSYWYSVNYIPVTPGDIITFWLDDNGTAWSESARFITAYDSDKNAISASGASSNTHSYTVPSGIAFIRFTISSAKSPSRIMVTINETPTLFEPYVQEHIAGNQYFFSWFDKNYNANKIITISAADGIDSFLEKMSNAFRNGKTDVYIGPGTYTYSNTFVESMRAANSRGVPIGNGCRYFFASGAYLVCDYTGSDPTVANQFSPLDSQQIGSDWEIHNLHLVAKNVCYAIHDEANGSNKSVRHIYKDCYIELDNTALGLSGNQMSKCIGGGLGKYEEVIIENCIFKCTNPAVPNQNTLNAIAYHGANNSTFTDAHIIIEGCNFLQGLFRTSDLSGNTAAPYPRVIYTNNIASRNPIIASTHTFYEWNNVLRP